MTNSPQSQDALDEILEKYFTGEQYDEVHGTYIRIPFTKQMEKAKQSLLAWRRTTSLEALPDPKIEDIDIPDTLHRNIGFNEAIDLTKKNMESLND